MAKYFIEDTTLKSMADTIRSLMGSTAPLTPSEMTAGVQEAKEDVDSAMDALETLGVEVPEGSDIGDLAGLVSEVEVGGGGGSVETAALTFLTPVSGAGEPFGGVYVSYIDETYTLQQPLVYQNVPITFYPIKNSIVFMYGAEVGNRTLGWLYSQGQTHCFVIGEDMSIQLLDL